MERTYLIFNHRNHIVGRIETGDHGTKLLLPEGEQRLSFGEAKFIVEGLGLSVVEQTFNLD